MPSFVTAAVLFAEVDWMTVWTAIGVVCGAEAVVFGLIITWQQGQINRISRAEEECVRRAERLDQRLTNYLMKLTECQQSEREAQRKLVEAHQDIKNLRYQLKVRAEREGGDEGSRGG